MTDNSTRRIEFGNPDGTWTDLSGFVTSDGLPDTMTTETTLTPVHLFGVVRFEPGGWVILNNSTHTPSGLASVRAVPETGELEIVYTTPLVTVGTANITMDEAYAGKVFAGPSVGLAAIFLTFRINGTTIDARSTTLKINNSNVFIDIWGHIATATEAGA